MTTKIKNGQIKENLTVGALKVTTSHPENINVLMDEEQERVSPSQGMINKNFKVNTKFLWGSSEGRVRPEKAALAIVTSLAFLSYPRNSIWESVIHHLSYYACRPWTKK